jgi:uncharacterized membrane protein YsdA (DUF1294 family)/cold shock CspA family protein
MRCTGKRAALTMRHKGRITGWKEARGFGFITPSSGGGKVFVHARSFENRRRRPVGNELVTYAMKNDAKGRAQAGRVSFADERSARARRRPGGLLVLALPAVFLVLLTLSVVTAYLPLEVLVLYLGASLVSFFAYARDKRGARQRRWRTPESTLHLLGLAGGWPGALAAQRLLRHKSRKRPFQVLFWGSVLINVSFLVSLVRSSQHF